MASSVEAKLIKSTKFPSEFNQKVDMQKVNVEVMKKWIAGKISEVLGSEDDVVTELCFNLLEGSRFPDIKLLQIQLTGFLDKDTAKFCKELWLLCLSAQTNPQGVPKELLEAKKLELIQEKPRKPPKKLSDVKSRRDNGIVILKTFARENGENAVGVEAMVKAAETIMNMIDAHHEIQDRLLQEGEAHQATVALQHVVTLILTFLPVEVAVGRTRGVADRPLPEGQTHILDPVPGAPHDEDTVMTPRLDQDVDNTLQVDLEPLPVVDIVEIGIEEESGGVMIEQDPILPHILLAHVHPEDVQGGDLLPYHLEVQRPQHDALVLLAIDEAHILR
ncbi:hypothetical protein ACLMJK_006822 [Lecanora helva]